MKFILEIIKRIAKILALYLLFGFAVAIAVSLSGAAENLLIWQTMGSMTLADYAILFAYVEILWLPLLAGMIFFPNNYLAFPLSSWVVPVIVISFFVLMIRTAIKE